MKWILLFTGLIIFSQLFTLALVFQFVIPDIVSGFGEKLYRKAEFTQNLYSQGLELTEETLAEIGDTDIRFTVLGREPADSGPAEEYRDIISLGMLQRAADGEIVMFYTGRGKNGVGMPCCLVSVGDEVALLTLDIRGNEIITFVSGIQQSITLGAIIGSVFIVIALLVIIRPIKKVTAATKEIAKGNFDVRLKTKSVDEVGQLIENFNLMALELQQNDYLKKDFVSSVSHEFKTPITSIEGFAKLLKNKNLTDEQFDEYTEIIIKQSERLSNLSSNLLKLSLLDSSAFEPSKTEFYLDEQIRNTILLLENQWEERNIDFDIEMDEVLFRGNEELLSHVWINLIQNAIKFSPDGGTVAVTLKEKDKTVTVSIADQGKGIKPEHGDKIFGRFYKADKSRSEEGNGLGLSIVKRIVEISKGTISFESKPGEGTAFFVVLPNKSKKN